MEKKITPTRKTKTRVAAKKSSSVKKEKKNVVAKKVNTTTINKATKKTAKRTAKKAVRQENISERGMVDTHFAFAVIALLAACVALYAWVSADGFEVSNGNSALNKKINRKNESVVISEKTCKPHYYDGEAKIFAWKVEDGENGDVIVGTRAEDMSKFPQSEVSAAQTSIKLINVSNQIKESLEAASAEKPAEITVKGYATNCGSDLPVASLESGAIAFNKKS